MKIRPPFLVFPSSVPKGMKRFSQVLTVIAFFFLYLFFPHLPIWGTEKKIPLAFFGKYKIDYQTGEISLNFQKMISATPKPFYPTFILGYHSYQSQKGIFGRKWTSNLEMKLLIQKNKILFLSPHENEGLSFLPDPVHPNLYKSQWGRVLKLEKREKDWLLKGSPWIHYRFSQDGRLLEVRHLSGKFLQYIYDPQGQLVEIRNHLGDFLRCSYKEGRLTEIRHSSRDILQFDYNEQGDIKTLWDSKGRHLSFAYDLKGHIISVNGGALELHYNSKDQIEIIDGSSVFRKMLSYRITPEAMITTVEDSQGNRTSYEFSKLGDSFRMVDAADNSYIYYLNKRRLVDMAVAPENQMTRFRYDRLGNLTEIIDPMGRSSRITYDKEGRVLSTRDYLGRSWHFQYFSNGLLAKIIDPLGEFQAFQYDSRGQLIKILSSCGTWMQYEYNKQGYVTKIRSSQGLEKSLAYDEKGRPVEIREKGISWRFRYSSDNRTITLEGPQEIRLQWKINLMGKVVEMQNSLGQKTVFDYNEKNLLQGVQYPDGSFSSFRYDELGRMIEFRDPDGRCQKFLYDSLGRPILWENGDGEKNQVEYNSLGLKSKKILPDGTEINYFYNSLGKITKIESPSRTDKFQYNSLGQLVSMENKDAKYLYEYDALGRLKKFKDLFLHQSLVYNYDKKGLLSSLDTPFGRIRYYYDQARRLQKILAPKGDAFHFEYDSHDRTRSILFPNQILTRFEYNPLGFLKTWKTMKKGRLLFSQSFQRNRLLKRKEVADEKGRKTKFYYDTRGRLRKIKKSRKEETEIITYYYDGVGNRIAERHKKGKKRKSKVYAYSRGGRLVLAGKFKYYYDRRGYLSRKEGPQGVWRYTFDERGKLVAVRTPEGKRIEYGYAPNGNRVWKKIGQKIWRYLYDGEDLIGIFQNQKKDSLILHGPGLDEPLALYRENREPLFLHQDGLSSVIALSTPSGNIAARYGYDSFGKRIQKWGYDSNNPFGFTGRILDSETGLYYYRARYYDPDTGRFLSPDPLLFKDGPNLYAYCQNDPVNFVDPFGTSGIWDSIKNGASQGWSSLKSGVSTVGDALSTVIHYVAEGAKERGTSAYNGLKSAYETGKRWGGNTLTFLGVGPEEEVNAMRDHVANSVSNFFGGGYIATQLTNFGVGVVSGLADGVKSLGNTILHPIESGKKLWSAIYHYDETWEGVKALWNEYVDAAYNDPAKFARMTGHLVGEIGAAILGDKGGKAIGSGLSKGLNMGRDLAQASLRNRRILSKLEKLALRKDRALALEKNLQKMKKGIKNLKGKRPKLRNKRRLAYERLKNRYKALALKPGDSRRLRDLTSELNKMKGKLKNPRNMARLKEIDKEVTKMLKEYGIENRRSFLEKFLDPHFNLEEAFGSAPHKVIAFALLRRTAVLLEETSAARKVIERGLQVFEGGSKIKKVTEPAAKVAEKVYEKREEARKEALEKLKERERSLERQWKHLSRIISSQGSSPGLTTALRATKAELDRTKRQIEKINEVYGSPQGSKGFLQKLEEFGK